jgi:mannose-6-phosphate isomerase-like protein (cupin superfamily)
MPVITAPASPSHELPGTRFTALASPSRGTTENSVWRVSLTPGTAPTAHCVTREEIFVITRGHGAATLDGKTHALGPGDTLVVPPRVAFSVEAHGPEPLEAIVCLPVGGQAMLPGGEPFTPPWAV